MFASKPIEVLPNKNSIPSNSSQWNRLIRFREKALLPLSKELDLVQCLGPYYQVEVLTCTNFQLNNQGERTCKPLVSQLTRGFKLTMKRQWQFCMLVIGRTM